MVSPVYEALDGRVCMRGRPMSDADAESALRYHAEAVRIGRRCRQSNRIEINADLGNELAAAIEACNAQRSERAQAALTVVTTEWLAIMTETLAEDERKQRAAARKPPLRLVPREV